MIYTIYSDFVFYQVISFIKKYKNEQIYLYSYFYELTKRKPTLIICLKDFIFFFVKPKDYFKCIDVKDKIRRETNYRRKIQIISEEKVFIKLIFRLFPDLYIHDIKLELDKDSGRREITLYFLTYKERGVAIGRGGSYIRIINELIERYIMFENDKKPIEIKCKAIKAEI